MISYKIYKKDLKKDKTEKIIVALWADGKKTFIITTLQAIEDYKRTGCLVYDKEAYKKCALTRYL